VAFFLDSQLVFLLESRSAFSPNMILNLLFCVIQAHKKRPCCEWPGFAASASIPAPVIAVFYTGKTRLREDQKTLRLSDLFADTGLAAPFAPALDVKIKVIDLMGFDDPYTAQILAKSPSLKGYAELAERIGGNIGSGMPVADAIKEAIDRSIGQGGAISGFLEEKRKAMVDMLFMEATEELGAEVETA
jgi:hypothetical protein